MGPQERATTRHFCQARDKANTIFGDFRTEVALFQDHDKPQIISDPKNAVSKALLSSGGRRVGGYQAWLLFALCRFLGVHPGGGFQISGQQRVMTSFCLVYNHAEVDRIWGI